MSEMYYQTSYQAFCHCQFVTLYDWDNSDSRSLYAPLKQDNWVHTGRYLRLNKAGTVILISFWFGMVLRSEKVPQKYKTR